MSRSHSFSPRAYVRAIVGVLAFLGASAGVAIPAQASAGLQVLLQPWNPANPDATSQPVSEYNDPTLFSDSIGRAWSDARGSVCTALTRELGKGDLIAHGVTLYNMTCSMGQVASIAIKQQHYGSNAVSLALIVPGNAFAATSTQPTVAGSYADPRFSVAYDVELDADLTLNPLSIANATIHVKNVSVDSQNAIADIAKALDDFFINGHYQKLAERELTINQALPVDKINSVLASVQTPIQSYIDRYAEIGFWVRNGVLIVDFAPRGVSNPGGGTISGAFTWLKSGVVKVPDCSGFTMQGSFESGPAPLLNPPGNLGDAPTMPVGSLSVGALVDRGDHYECPYSFSGVPIGFPTMLSPKVTGASVQTASNGGGHFGESIVVAPVGWSDPIVPSGSTSGKNFAVVSVLLQTKPFGYVSKGLPNGPGDPINEKGGAQVVLPSMDRTTTGPALSTNSGATHGSMFLAHTLSSSELLNAGLASLKGGARTEGIAKLQAAYTQARAAGDLATMRSAESALRNVGGAIPAAVTAPATAVVP